MVSNMLVYLRDLEVLEGFKQLRETCRIHFRLAARQTAFMGPSYDPKTKICLEMNYSTGEPHITTFFF